MGITGQALRRGLVPVAVFALGWFCLWMFVAPAAVWLWRVLFDYMGGQPMTTQFVSVESLLNLPLTTPINGAALSETMLGFFLAVAINCLFWGIVARVVHLGFHRLRERRIALSGA